MAELSPETQIALLGQAMQHLRDAVDDIQKRMVTHADLEKLATDAEVQALTRRVDELKTKTDELERGSLRKLWGSVTAFTAGGLTIWAAIEALGKIFGKGH
jgi:uncharacterized protein Yka (UPF0111/DUF47 family)